MVASYTLVLEPDSAHYNQHSNQGQSQNPCPSNTRPGTEAGGRQGRFGGRFDLPAALTFYSSLGGRFALSTQRRHFDDAGDLLGGGVSHLWGRRLNFAAATLTF